MLYALLAGGVDTGWTFYTPSAPSLSTNVIATGLAIFINGFSSILTGLNFIVTIHRMRAPGMTWFALPLFVWSNYATSIIMCWARQSSRYTIVLVAFERIFHLGIFDPRLGGDPLLFQHLFWFYSHPAVYIMILPAMGVISEIIACFSHRTFSAISSWPSQSRDRGARFPRLGRITCSSPAIGLTRALIFSFLSYMVAIPSAIKVFNWTATLYKGSISYRHADALRARLHRPVHDGRADRTVPGRARRRRARDRHLLRHRALPLHHGRRHGDGLSWRACISGGPRLAGRMYPEGWGKTRRAGHLRRLQSDLLPAVHPGLPGHAAALLAVSARNSRCSTCSRPRAHRSWRSATCCR